MGGFLVAFWLAHFGWELEREVDGKTPQLEGEPQLILITKQLWSRKEHLYCSADNKWKKHCICQSGKTLSQFLPEILDRFRRKRV